MSPATSKLPRQRIDNSTTGVFDYGVSKFNITGGMLAVLSPDARLKTWDSSSGHVLLDLTSSSASSSASSVGRPTVALSQHCCFAWSSKAYRGKGKKGSKPSIAVGLLSGEVLLWDVTTGDIKWKTANCHSGKVSSVSFSSTDGSVYSVGLDGYLCVIDAGSGALVSRHSVSKHPLSHIAASPDGSMVMVASSQVKVLETSGFKKKLKLEGHANEVRCAAFSADGRQLITSGAGESKLVVWGLDSSKGTSQVLGSLTVEHEVLSVQTMADSDSGVAVLALTASGEVYVWRAQDMAAILSSSALRVQSPATAAAMERQKKGQSEAGTSRGDIVAAQLLPGGTLLLARGKSVKPTFERLSLGSSHTSSAVVVLTALSAEQQVGLVRAKPSEGGGSQKPSAAPMEVVDAIPFVQESRSKRKGEEEETVRVAEGNGGGDSAPAAATLEDGLDASLEERLAGLGLNPDGSEALPEGNTGEHYVPQASSVHVLLEQALQAEDKGLLDRCLHVQEVKVINNSVRRLRPGQAVKLLSASVSRLYAKPSRGSMLVPWIRSVLLHHTAFLMSSPSAQPILVSLSQTIHSRLAVLHPMMALSGRLDLLLTQVRVAEGARTAQVQPSEMEEVATYEEEDGSNRDVEDEEQVMDAMATSDEEDDEVERNQDDDSDDDDDDDGDEWEETDDDGGEDDRPDE